jgi:hypothetical protein
MSIPKQFTIGGALIGLVIVAIVGYVLLQPPGPLLQDVGFSITTISPNADGIDDVAVFSYTLSDNAEITLTFENEDGQAYLFRDAAPRAEGNYSVDFSGVVDGFSLPSDELAGGTIERRLLPDGHYSWTLRAKTDDGETDSASGTLSIEGGDSVLPAINAFDVSSSIFTPNQDGIRDRVTVNVYLDKDSNLDVYLENDAGEKIFLGERLEGRDPGEEGSHEFDYDGGVDDGFEPPADGDYTLYAVAHDDEGQRVVRTTQLTIEDGGLPQAEIVAQSTGAQVCFSVLPWDDRYYTTAELEGDLINQPDSNCSNRTRLTLQRGDLLVFTLSVWNYGRTPIRTTGPFSGTVYQFEQLPTSLGFFESDGSFRVGLYCQSVFIDHPWRWGLGSPDQLTAQPQFSAINRVINQILQIDYDTFYYLMPGERAVVWGAVRMTEIFEEKNPQNCSVSLIHEGVTVVPFQQGLGVREIEIMPEANLPLDDDEGFSFGG